MNNRHKRRQKRKAFTLINLILLFACILGLTLIFYLYQGSNKFGLSDVSRFVPKISLFHHKKTAKKETTKLKKTHFDSSKSQKKAHSKLTWTKQETPVKIPILMYHAIHVMSPEETANANLIVNPDLFDQQLQKMKDEGYYFLSPEEVYRALSNNELPAKKVVWLTFDDSMIDFYNVAYPILKNMMLKPPIMLLQD